MQISGSFFHAERQLLWAQGEDLVADSTVMVPYESVHTDFRLPLPSGSGSFLMSSNGLASGNAVIEATLHGLYELVERDANTLWSLSGFDSQARRRVDLKTINDPSCVRVLGMVSDANLGVAIWDTTSDTELPSFVCTIFEHDTCKQRNMPPAHGAGCHTRRHVALIRAITEAAQSRLTLISGSRDDLDAIRGYAGHDVETQHEASLALVRKPGPGRPFDDAPDYTNSVFEADLSLVLGRLQALGLRQVVRVDLTLPEFGVPVVKMIVPHLEGMSGSSSYVPGIRGRRVLARPAP
jgi:ribosomal protein S12 methylthiotransferase accessory factor